jgi:hypothetical protein
MDEFKLIIAGGRDFKDHDLLTNTLHRGLIGPLKSYQVSVVSGEARGADRTGAICGDALGLHVHKFPADWGGLGKRAGFVRNQQMAEFADGLLAFWDGQSRGTADMIGRMRRLGKPVKIVMYSA